MVLVGLVGGLFSLCCFRMGFWTAVRSGAQAHGLGFGRLRAFAGARVPGEILPRAGGS